MASMTREKIAGCYWYEDDAYSPQVGAWPLRPRVVVLVVVALTSSGARVLTRRQQEVRIPDRRFESWQENLIAVLLLPSPSRSCEFAPLTVRQADR